MPTKSNNGTSENECCCPHCGGAVYRGSHNGQSMYKCMSDNRCDWEGAPIARTKEEVKLVNAQLQIRRDQPLKC